MTSLDRSRIDPDADRVVRKLARGGYVAYLVGGCVRDILVGRRPKDFDVATSATPNEVRAVFRNCRIIGRRFRLAHVFFGDKIIETATFRASPREDDGAGDGDADLLIRRDNVFGTETEDARRRDFTINGLFYDVEKEEVIDHVDGLADLRQALVRTIGDPDVRFQEDPIRMLRAIKFAARLNFQIERGTYRALLRWREEIRKAAPPRVLEEIFRLMRGGAARRSMELLIETDILPILSTVLADLYQAAPPASAEVDDAADDDDDVEAPGADGDAELDDEERRWRAVWSDGGRIAPPPRRAAHRATAPVSAAQREQAWRMLDGIDAAIGADHELSSAAIFTALVLPFCYDALIAARPAEVFAVIGDALGPLVDDVRVTRRDSERMRILLTMVRRIATARARGGEPELSGGADLAAEAAVLDALMARARGQRASLPAHGEASGEHLSEHDADGDGDPNTVDGEALPRKRRRRRRGGQRAARRDPTDGTS